MTLNQIIFRIKSLALAHKQIRNFYQGLVTDFLTDKTTNYPSTFLQSNGGKVSTSGHSATLNFRMFFLDLVHVSDEAKANELDIQSDMLLVAMDIVAQMNFGTYNDWKLSTDNNLQLVYENDNDLIAGVYLDFSISIMFDQNVCQVPTTITGLDPIEPSDMKQVYDLEYIATGNEGTTLSLPRLVDKTVLLIIRENNPLHKVSNNPDSAEYEPNGNDIILGIPTIAGNRFLILFK